MNMSLCVYVITLSICSIVIVLLLILAGTLLLSYDLAVAPSGPFDPLLGPGHIDMVVTWAGPPNHERSTTRRRYLRAFDGQTNVSTTGDEVAAMRIDDNGEMVALLQRAYLFGGKWLRKIHIICPIGSVLPECQIRTVLSPAAYEEVRSRIQIHSEADIVPKEALPLFNSHAFEANLDRVPGLSERFLYACDDMWLNAKIPDNSFFDTEGRPRLLMKRNTWLCLQKNLFCMSRSIHHQAMHNSSRMVKSLVKKSFAFLSPEHHIHPLTREGFELARQAFPEDFERVTRSRFRTHTDFHPVALVQNMLRVRGLASVEPCELRHCLLNMYEYAWRTRLGRHMSVLTGSLTAAHLLCINDHCNHKTPQFHAWLRRNALISFV